MLPRAQRLSREQIATVMARGRTFISPPAGQAGGGATLRVLPASGPSRFAIVVPARQIKGAVRRNRVKRRARAVIRDARPSLRDNYWAVFFMKSEMATFPFPKFRETMLTLLHQAKIA